MGKTTLPGITLPRGADASQRSIVDILQKLSGQSGSGLDRAVLIRDLVDAKGINLSRNRGVLEFEFDNSGDYSLPSAPTGVEVLPTFNTVFLRWNEPDPDDRWYALTEIFRLRVHLEDDGTPYVESGDGAHVAPAFSMAVRVLTVQGNLITDYVDSGQSFVYWIRHVNKAGVSGPIHDTNGSLATTYRTPLEVLEEYSADIYQGENYQWLRSELREVENVHRIYHGADVLGDSPLLSLIEGTDDLMELLAQQQLMNALDSYHQQEAIKVKFDKNYAKLSGGVHAAVNADQAYVNRIEVLESHWEDNGLAENTIDAKIDAYNLALTSPSGALATSINNIRVNFNSNSSTIQEFAEAVASADRTINSSIRTLNSTLSDTSSALQTFQQTQTEENRARSTEITNLSSVVGDYGANLQTLTQTVATNEGEYNAQWGIKTNVNDLRGGVGFYNDGTATSFLVDSQAFAVTGGNGSPVFPFVIKDGKTVIKEALIDTAAIYTLIAANIVAEKIAASIRIESPVINGGSITGTSLNINDRTKISSTGLLETLNARIHGVIRATSGELDNVVINENCDIKGTLSVRNVDGDVVDRTVVVVPKDHDVGPSQRYVLIEGEIKPGVLGSIENRILVVSGISLDHQGGGGSSSNFDVYLYLNGSQRQHFHSHNVEEEGSVTPQLGCLVPVSNQVQTFKVVLVPQVNDWVRVQQSAIVADVFKRGSTFDKVQGLYLESAGDSGAVKALE
ncbi:DUF1983 domain-containing protein [Endozoicomonas sp. G2_1]|uniref:phage tail tip fiber protein n=1 Tax=Endozoicomonas sp. G2_1 TaxID=2821091 RepID=UPI001ADCE282|nr:DUF1983 domain-containing protein [Endozoicomonas sp. G2_1]MBO9492225.1 DUF1983 domain-containing protein [Endozoicomonas sp. G2_1]